MTLKLGRHEFTDDATLMMAIVNRTPDSFYDKGATWAEDKAIDRVAQASDEGAEIVDIGGAPGRLAARLGQPLGAGNVAAVDPSQPFVDACRARLPGVDARLAPA